MYFVLQWHRVKLHAFEVQKFHKHKNFLKAGDDLEFLPPGKIGGV